MRAFMLLWAGGLLAGVVGAFKREWMVFNRHLDMDSG